MEMLLFRLLQTAILYQWKVINTYNIYKTFFERE